MKIAIFGDSFGNERSIYEHHPGDLPWVQHLKNMEYDVTNFCEMGSSLMYSYSMLRSSHAAFDKVVFLITGSSRIYVDSLPDNYKHCTSGVSEWIVQHFKNNPDMFNSSHLKVAEAVESYYKYVMNYDKEATFHRLLYKEICSIRPDALMLPCFPPESLPISTTPLMSLSDYDREYFNLPPDSRTYRIDKRFCHMNEGNNLMLANKIKQWIETGEFSINREEFCKPQYELDYYYQNTMPS